MTTWTNETKTSDEDSFLLKEDSFFLLLENGFKIVLKYANSWTNEIK